MDRSRIELFPVTASVNSRNHLSIGRCDCTELIKRYGSPLYVFDEATIRTQCRQFHREFRGRYDNTVVAYACKAFISKPVAAIMEQEKMGLDVVSGGELSVARAVGFPADRIHFHGNNKSAEELKMAIEYGVGRIVVDNFYELGLLDEIAGQKKVKVDILLRLNPGIDPHTHRHTATGILDSKFGFPVNAGLAEQAIKVSLSSKSFRLRGLHFHLGSPISEIGPYLRGLQVVMDFARNLKKIYGFEMEELSPGGGFPVKYTSSAELPSIANYAEEIVNSLITMADDFDLTRPKLIIEPGRSIIARAGVAIYTVGAIKDIPGIRTYVCVDGGMGDNIRPVLYEAKYEAVVANKIYASDKKIVTVAGRFCESGDILIKDIELPEVEPGDLLAVPVCGAYCIPMASNYNMVPFPAIVIVNEGHARIIRRRQKYSDLMKYDLMTRA